MLILLYTDPLELKITKLLIVTTGESRRDYLSHLLWQMRKAVGGIPSPGPSRRAGPPSPRKRGEGHKGSRSARCVALRPACGEKVALSAAKGRMRAFKT